MKKSLILRLFATFLCIAVLTTGLFVWCTPLSVYAVTDSDINNKKDEAQDVKDKKEETQKKIQDLKEQAKTTNDYIESLDGQMSELDSQIYDLKNQIEDLNIQIADTEDKLVEAQDEADQQYEMMKLRIQFMYENNNETYIALMLSSQSIGEMLNRAEYISKISAYDREMLEKYNETIQFIADSKQQLEDDQESIAQKQLEVEEQKQSLQIMYDEKQKEVSEVEGNLAAASKLESELAAQYESLMNEANNMAAQMQREEEERQRQLAAQQAAGNTGNAAAQTTGTGQFIWPTPSRRITSDYGTVDAGLRNNSAHNGIDIGASTPGVSGDPIYAADSGTVTVASYSASAGNWIWISHGNGLYSIYMHCSKLYVSVGQSVTKGQTIALMGSTGYSTGAHLHFGVSKNGVIVNPWTYLR